METSGKKVVELNIQDVLPNRFQPRIKFNEEAINELSKSIKEHGVIQPIVVRPIGDKFEIIAGERRYKASCMAELKTIPAIITDLNDKDSAEVALIENVQRENLTPIEEAISYKKILDMGYITQDALASKLGKTQSTVANKLRLLNLDDDVQEALLNEKISERHARSLLKLQNKEQQKQLLNKIINERLTVRRADEEIEKILNGGNMNETITKEPIEQPVITQEEPKEFKFINVPNIEEPKEEIKEEPEIEEDEIRPGKFFNILEDEEKTKKPEEQI
jgi:ParB family chromosome partitioning protein